uniref:Uncharacterized protein n=1 Tax=Aegilops tauschii subsp. strangulata TaxID=200361 RepID=A0A453HCD6_AEGTS
AGAWCLPALESAGQVQGFKNQKTPPESMRWPCSWLPRPPRVPLPVRPRPRPRLGEARDRALPDHQPRGLRPRRRQPHGRRLRHRRPFPRAVGSRVERHRPRRRHQGAVQHQRARRGLPHRALRLRHHRVRLREPPVPRGQHHRRARVQRGRLHARGLWRGGRLRGRRAGRRHHHLRPHRRRVRGPPRHRPPPVPPLRLQGRGAALLPPARVPQSIVNPVQPTLATECNEAGRFMLNITRFNGSVAIDTGVVQASHTCTVFDQNPVAIFAVSKVLLPKEMFGRGNTASPRAAAPPATMTPDLSDGLRTPPTKLSSPPALRGQDN